MRKIVSLTFLSLVLSLSVYMVTLSAQEVPPGQICQQIVGSSPFLSQGSCASCIAHLENGGPITLSDIGFCVCKIAKDNGELEAAGLNFGQCLQLFK